MINIQNPQANIEWKSRHTIDISH